MDAHDSLAAGRPARRRWLALAILAVVLVAALVAFGMRWNAASAAKPEDCETKPPPNTFAVAQCDDGGAAGAQKPGAVAPSRPKP